MHTIGLDTTCYINLVLIHLKGRDGIYESVRADMIANQADKPKISKVIESWGNKSHY